MGGAAVVLAALLAAGCSSVPTGPPPDQFEARLCSDLEQFDEMTKIGAALDSSSNSGDVTTQLLQAEGTVRQRCPDVLWKLDRYREQVVEPVVGR